MIKQLSLLLAVSGALFLTSCGGGAKTDDKDAAEGDGAAAPTLTINEADWVPTDLSTVSNLTPVTVNLPKDAKMEKNGNGGVDIKLADWYTITVYNNASSSVKEALDGDKTISSNHSSYKEPTFLVDEANGYVYTNQMKDEANGNTYKPESHFYFYVEKEGMITSFHDEPDFNTDKAAYSPELAKQIYNIIKSSAKTN